MLPNETRDGFLTVELHDELLVYDRRRDRAHCLNRTAARVWRLWDGRLSIPEVAVKLSHELLVPASEDLVRLALGRLRSAGLLDEAAPCPPSEVSRREMLRRIRRAGELALLLPAITSVCIQDLQDLSLDPLPAEGPPRGRIAWRTAGGGVCDAAPGLFLGTWENPRPRRKVKSIDYVSAVTDAAPFCAALTTAWCVERDEQTHPDGERFRHADLWEEQKRDVLGSADRAAQRNDYEKDRP